MSKIKKSKDSKQKAVEFAMSMRGQMLIGKALHYGMIKIMEVEKEREYYKSRVKELKELKSQTSTTNFINSSLESVHMKRIVELEEFTKDYKTSDVQDLEYIAENLYAPWIEMCKFTEQFDKGGLDKLLKTQK